MLFPLLDFNSPRWLIQDILWVPVTQQHTINTTKQTKLGRLLLSASVNNPPKVFSNKVPYG